MLSGNEIREIIMDSDSDEHKYYDSAMEDEEPRPPLRQFHFMASKSRLFHQQL
jgi:hypothetical protein